jgi:hypothetical protein
LRRPGGRQATPLLALASGAVATAGRWSLAGRLFAPSVAGERQALAELLLERQGIVTRDGVRAGDSRGYGPCTAS